MTETPAKPVAKARKSATAILGALPAAQRRGALKPSPFEGKIQGKPATRGVVEMLGGPRVLGQQVHTSLDAHDLLKAGLPAGALQHLVEQAPLLRIDKNFTTALGMSPRTHQRKKADDTNRLSRAQSGRAWKFAEVLTRASDVFGSQERAESWLTEPAMALDRRTPLELLDTAAGLELVEDLLIRLDYGVYT